MRRVRTLATAVAVTAILGACGAPPPREIDTVNDVDRQRAAILGADPILADAIDPPQIVPGRLRSERVGWERSEVRARLYEYAPPATGAGPRPAAVEVKLAQVVTALRAEGWRVYWVLCTPPPAVPETGELQAAQVRLPPDVDRHRAWQWVAFAYKVDGGVSYWAQLSAELDEATAGASIDILLRAPHARDQANLFADAPKPLAPGRSCVDDRRDTKQAEQAGTLTYLRDWLPFPAQSHSPDPTRR